MAKLPSFTDVSGPASLRPPGGVSVADTSGLTRGINRLASGLGDLAQGFDSAAATVKNRENVADIAKAEASWMRSTLDIGNKFDQGDDNYQTYEQRAGDMSEEAKQKAAELIRDPEMKEKWLGEAELKRMSLVDSVGDKGRALSQQADVVSLESSIKDVSVALTDPTTPDALRKQIRADIQGNIDMGLSTGMLTPAGAEALTAQYLDGADKQLALNRANLAKEQDPEGLVTQLGIPESRAAYYQSIKSAESGGNPNAKNPLSSATGLYQMTSGTWSDLIKANPNAGLTANGRTDPAQQEIAIRLLTDANAKTLEGAGIPATNGNLYAAHFLGAGGATQVLKAADGAAVAGIVGKEVVAANPFLANMTVGQFRAWAAKKGNGNPPGQSDKPNAAYADLPFETRLALYEQSMGTINQRNTAAAAAAQGAIEVAATNAPVAIQNTGAYTGTMPTAENFTIAYGADEGAARYSQFQAAIETSQTAYNMRGMSDDEINATLDRAKPTSTGNDAALETKKYEVLASAAAATMKARADDPAGYTLQTFPNVATAWQDASKPGADPAAIASAIAMTAAAEKKLGMDTMVLLPKSMADGAAATFNDPAQPSDKRAAALTQMVFSTQDPEQQKAIFEQMVASGVPAFVQGAMDAVIRGDAGAAQYLFRAAFIDPKDLVLPKDVTPEVLKDAIRSTVFEDGSVGDVVYGFTDGLAGGMERAAVDMTLMERAAKLRLVDGSATSADQAMQMTMKDMFGDVRVVDETAMKITLPKDEDVAPIRAGFQALTPKVVAAITADMGGPVDPVLMGPTFMLPEPAAGLIAPGNLDLNARKVLVDGKSYKTEESISIPVDDADPKKGEVLIPTVVGGKKLTDQEAIDHYLSSGENLGTFSTPDLADAYAEKLHLRQEQVYRPEGDKPDASTGEAAIVDATRKEYIAAALSQGYFTSAGSDEYVFIDHHGLQVTGPDGKPMVFSKADVLAAGTEAGAKAATPGQTSAAQSGTFSPSFSPSLWPGVRDQPGNQLY